ncbi:MAG: hypothetical protein NVS9B10_05020 [Nevskia sp.]
MAVNPAGELATRIDALLPQTQCTRCGYDGCRPYAEAVAAGDVPINRCPPGGEATILALAELLQVPALPLNPECGVETAQAVVALIDEALCIGCYKCVLVCPVDAILGAPKFMHTVLAADCSGCELCLPPCPVNCISLVARPAALPAPAAQAPRWRRLHVARKHRLAAEREQRGEARRRRRTATLKEQAQAIDIAAAIARARARRNS